MKRGLAIGLVLLVAVGCGGSAPAAEPTPTTTPEPTPVPSVTDRQWDRCLDSAMEMYGQTPAKKGSVGVLIEFIDRDYGSTKKLLRALNADYVARKACLALL